jgi:hypothetical protein
MVASYPFSFSFFLFYDILLLISFSLFLLFLLGPGTHCARGEAEGGGRGLLVGRLQDLRTKLYDVVCVSCRNHVVFTPLLSLRGDPGGWSSGLSPNQSAGSAFLFGFVKLWEKSSFFDSFFLPCWIFLLIYYVELY